MSPLPPATWFILRREEQVWITAILAIFLFGLVARHLHLRQQAAQSEPAESSWEPTNSSTQN